VPSEMSRDQLNHLARLGARVRLAEIKQERAALNAILSDGASDNAQMQTPPAEPVRRRRRRRATWTAAQRKAVSQRMKKYCTKALRGSYYTHHAVIAA
jgi:hypothetical protein